MRTGAFQGIEKLRGLYAHDDPSLRLLEEKEAKLRRAIDAAKLAEYPEVQAIVEDGKRHIRQINALLLADDTLDEKTRTGLMYERDTHEFYLSRFSAEIAVREAQASERWVEQQLAIEDKKTS